MAYSSQTDVQNRAGGSARLRELSDFENAGSINATIVAAAIAEADAWIDTFVQKRFAVPLSPVPTSVLMLSANEAVYRMKKWRSQATAEDDEDHIIRRDLLTAFANGANVLGVEPLPAKSKLVADVHLPVSSSAAEDDNSIARQRDKWKGFS